MATRFPGLLYRIVSGDSQRGLWSVGRFRSDSTAAPSMLNPFLMKTLGWSGIFCRPNYGIGMLAAGVILSIMILPIISSLTREVMWRFRIPAGSHLALGATRWEVTRIGVLSNAQIGLLGAVILSLGRALGRNHGGHHGHRQPPRDCGSFLAPGSAWPVGSPTNSARPRTNCT